MTEIVVISGKGGTGKTTISTALAELISNKVMVDCDVDAANFNLILKNEVQETHEFKAGFEPFIDEALCQSCGRCQEICRFSAIYDGKVYDRLACEGCGTCATQCPFHAISLIEKGAGQWMISSTPYGPLVHAKLNLAIENSGKLVSKVRQEAKKIATDQKMEIILSDGPPGVGCQVIAALTGVNLALVVVEPTVSAMHDMERVTKLAKHFKIPVAICINKSTLCNENTDKIEQWCHRNGYPILGEIPFDEKIISCLKRERSILQDMPNEFGVLFREMWGKTASLLNVTP